MVVEAERETEIDSLQQLLPKGLQEEGVVLEYYNPVQQEGRPLIVNPEEAEDTSLHEWAELFGVEVIRRDFTLTEKIYRALISFQESTTWMKNSFIPTMKQQLRRIESQIRVTLASTDH